MKNKISHKKAYRIVAALVMTLVIGIYLATSNFSAYASDIVITGDVAGAFQITSADTMLFDLTGLYPGDTNASTVTISNTDMENDGFEVFMFARNTVVTEYDLGRVTRLTVTDTSVNAIIYDGMLINFDDEINSIVPISLGRLPQGTSRRLIFTIEIDGERADNNYQNQQSQLVVTFVANSYGEPVVIPTPNPPTPPPPPPPVPDDTTDISDDDVPLGGIELEEPEAPLDNIELETPEVPTDNVELETPEVPTDDIEPEEVETIELEDEDTPLDNIELEEPEVPSEDIELETPEVPAEDIEQKEPETIDPEEVEIIEVEDEDVPLGPIKDIPETGEIKLAIYRFTGILVICCALIIIAAKSKRKER